jgi:hypothetical protein
MPRGVFPLLPAPAFLLPPPERGSGAPHRAGAMGTPVGVGVVFVGHLRFSRSRSPPDRFAVDLPFSRGGEACRRALFSLSRLRGSGAPHRAGAMGTPDGEGALLIESPTPNPSRGANAPGVCGRPAPGEVRGRAERRGARRPAALHTLSKNECTGLVTTVRRKPRRSARGVLGLASCDPRWTDLSGSSPLSGHRAYPPIAGARPFRLRRSASPRSQDHRAPPLTRGCARRDHTTWARRESARVNERAARPPLPAPRA